MIGEHKVNKKRLIKLCILVVIVLVSVFLSFKMAKYVLPFLLGFLIASLLKPLILFLIKKLKFKRWIACLLSILVFYLTIGTLATFIAIGVVNQAISIASNISDWINIISSPLSNLLENVSNLDTLFPDMSIALSDHVNNVIVSFVSSFSDGAKTIAQTILNTAISLPSAFIFIIITILSTFFIAKDRTVFRESFRKQFPSKWIASFYKSRHSISGTLLKWVKAQSIIMSITFMELFVGLTIYRVKYALLVAFIVAIIDILPVLGTGTVLIPWILFSLITGNSTLAIKLLVLYLVVTIVRQLIEPKIVGKEIGIHPLVTLIAMYLGVQVFGILGFLVGPIYIMISKNLILGILNGKTIEEYISLRPKKYSYLSKHITKK